MRIKKVRNLFSYSPSEIFAVFASLIFLIISECQIRMTPSQLLLQQLQNPPWFSQGRFFLNPLQKIRKTRLVSLVEALDKNLGWKPSCLRRTFALAGLFRSQGLFPTLKIGVHRHGNVLEAHSWFELDGLRLEMQDPGNAYEPLESSQC